MDTQDYWPADAQPTIGKQGYLGLTVPPEYGVPPTFGGHDRWSLGYATQPGPVALRDNLCANNIYLNGTEEQRRRLLPGLCDGTKVAAGMSEPGAGDTAPPMRTAAREGDEYVSTAPRSGSPTAWSPTSCSRARRPSWGTRVSRPSW